MLVDEVSVDVCVMIRLIGLELMALRVDVQCKLSPCGLMGEECDDTIDALVNASGER